VYRAWCGATGAGSIQLLQQEHHVDWDPQRWQPPEDQLQSQEQGTGNSQQCSSVVCYMSSDHCLQKTLVQAFIFSRLDYCNSLLHGLLDTLLRKLLSVQIAAAWLITGTWRCDHIKPVSHQLNWLPVRHCIEFKVACLVHQLLSGQAPGYMSDDCRLVSETGWRVLRSVSIMMYGVADTKQEFCSYRPTLAEQPATITEIQL